MTALGQTLPSDRSSANGRSRAISGSSPARSLLRLSAETTRPSVRGRTSRTDPYRTFVALRAGQGARHLRKRANFDGPGKAHLLGGLAVQRLLGCIVGAMLLLWTGAASADLVKVGLIASYTGAFATWGTQFQQAVEAYQSSHGKIVKGPDGKEHEIEFIYRDVASQGPDKAKQLAEELILRDRVKFIAGLELSPHAMALADISKEAKVPVVILNAATSSITRMSPYFVRVSMTVPQFVSPMGPWAVAHGIKRAYVIVSDYAPGYDAEAYFTKSFKAAGGEIVGNARTPQQETNFSAYMERVLQAKPDAPICSSRPARRRSLLSRPMSNAV